MDMVESRGAALTGLGIGAGLMYFLDPDRGRRRRARVRDRMTHSAHLGADAFGATSRDLANRARGMAARARNVWYGQTVDDAVLVEQVRARLGRLVSHPHAIAVKAVDGCITLRGPILQSEEKRLLYDVKRIPGVRVVENALDAHKQAGNHPSLQGGAQRSLPQMDIWQRMWSPATRILVGGAGAAIAGYGVTRRDMPGAMAVATGLGLIARAASNLEARRLLGVGAGRRAVDVQKVITIDAPRDEVFQFWASYENFPRFMSRVLDVRPSARDGQSHWTVAGPAGMPIEFDAEVSAFRPNELLGWRTVPGSPVGHAGLVRFEPAGIDGTRVNVRMSYNPPGGWLGHGVAAAFGVDPKSSMDADLARMKTLLETGRPPRDAAQPF
jgi:uncharacterized membrane protein